MILAAIAFALALTPPIQHPMTYEQLLASKHIDRAKLPKVEVKIAGKGSFIIELVPDLAPKTCEQILKLTKEGFYTGQRVHRVEDWVVQWGDPQSKKGNFEELPVGTEGSGHPLPYEDNAIPLTKGVFAMASTGAKVGGDSQVFILTKEDPQITQFLQGKYAAFGFVIHGMEVVEKLKRWDKIESMDLVQK